jgi:hypothetical protein
VGIGLLLSLTGCGAGCRGTDCPAVVLTLRSGGHELDQLLTDPAFFGPLWGRTDVGVRLDRHDDRTELAELLAESYRLRAPKTLVRRWEA